MIFSKELPSVLEDNVEKFSELYEIPEFNCHIEFLENISKKKNFKIKAGYLDVERAARFSLNCPSSLVLWA